MAPVGTPGGGGGTSVCGGGGAAADAARELPALVPLPDEARVAAPGALPVVVFGAGLAAPVVETQRGSAAGGGAAARRERSRSR